ncbi:MAG: hypothetical protein C4321_08850, partial [Chloroflexota bacterium]
GKAHEWAASQKRQPNITDPNEDPDALIEATTASSRTPLGDKPLIVISAGRLSFDPQDRASGATLREQLRAHVRSEAFLTTLSRNSRFIVARRSFHKVHLYEPELVTEAIREVVMAVRSGKKLGVAE